MEIDVCASRLLQIEQIRLRVTFSFLFFLLHRFFSSESSRGPLCCNKEQLSLLLTHYQVMPQFLDFVFMFKIRRRPLAHAAFRHENYLSNNGVPLRLPTLGRSGVQIQHAFCLLSVEENRQEIHPWPLRQMVLYHSFDCETGKAVWMILKANGSMRSSMEKELKGMNCFQPKLEAHREHSFSATLRIHLLVIEWCAENWAKYIDYMEDEIKDKSTDARAAPVTAMTSPIPLQERFLKTNPSWKIGNNDSQPQDRPRNPTRAPSFGRTLSSFFRRSSGITQTPSDIPLKGRTEQNDISDDEFEQDLDERFSFKEIQRLSFSEEELEQSSFAIGQNRRVLGQIREQYKEVTKSHGFLSNMDTTAHSVDISSFLRHIQVVEDELDRHNSRLQALLRNIESDKKMVCALFFFLVLFFLD
jgi:hypothetical protein